jgi:hypothetical protein
MAKLIRKVDAAEWTARRAAKAAVKAAHGSGQNVPALRDRLDNVESALGMVPTAK